MLILILALGKLDRVVKIARTLIVENKYQCTNEDVQRIALFCVFTELTDREIQERVLQAHIFEQLKAAMGMKA